MGTSMTDGPKLLLQIIFELHVLNFSSIFFSVVHTKVLLLDFWNFVPIFLWILNSKISRKYLVISRKYLVISRKYLVISRNISCYFAKISRYFAKYLVISRTYLVISRNYLVISRKISCYFAKNISLFHEKISLLYRKTRSHILLNLKYFYTSWKVLW